MPGQGNNPNQNNHNDTPILISSSPPAAIAAEEEPPPPPWPFSHPPIHVGTVASYPLTMSIVSPHDGLEGLQAVAQAAARYAWYMKSTTTTAADAAVLDRLPPATRDEKWATVVRRFRNVLGRVVNSCVPGRVTGLVVKIVFRDRVEGVLVIKLVAASFQDTWSQNEYKERDQKEAPWVYPCKFMDILRTFIASPENGARPVLAIPHIIPSCEPNLQPHCMTAFIRLIVKLSLVSRHSVLLNIHGQPAHAVPAPYLHEDTLFEPFSDSYSDDLPAPAPASTSTSESSGRRVQPYKAYARFAQPLPDGAPDDRPDRTLDRGLRVALDSWRFEIGQEPCAPTYFGYGLLPP